jgi:hypothetical protein
MTYKLYKARALNIGALSPGLSSAKAGDTATEKISAKLVRYRFNMMTASFNSSMPMLRV